MNTEALAALGKHAKVWAQTYVALKGALLKEGVPADEAIETARDVTNLAALYDVESGERCPLCGRGE